MFNRLHRWIICWAAERGGDLPRWTARRVERDGQLRRYHEAVRDLPARLAADAARLRQADQPLAPIATMGRRSYHEWRMASIAALAAIVLLTISLFTMPTPPMADRPGDDQTITVTPDALVDQVAVAMDDSLKAEWRLLAADSADLARIMLAPLPRGE